MVKRSLTKFSFVNSLALFQNIIVDSELARFLKQTLIFNENNFSRFDDLKSYFGDELILSSFLVVTVLRKQYFINILLQKIMML